MSTPITKDGARKIYQISVKGAAVWEDIPKQLFDLMRDKATHVCRIVRKAELERATADALAWRMVAKGFAPEASPMWFVVPGISGAENPILLFTSREVAEQYCLNNPSPTGYSIYAAVAA